MTTIQKLINRLKNAGITLPDKPTFQRTYAGSNQRSAGAWSWFIINNGRPLIGSQWSVTELLKEKTIAISINRFGDWNIDPETLPKDTIFDQLGRTLTEIKLGS